MVSHLYGNKRGGSHGGVAKWDLRTQGGQVSRALITGLNADTASSSHQGGRNRSVLDSVQYHCNYSKWLGEVKKLIKNRAYTFKKGKEGGKSDLMVNR